MLGVRCCLLALAVLIFSAPASALASELRERDRAEPLRGWDIVGQRAFSSAEYVGHWTYVLFTATWCYPCMEEYPTLLPEMKRLRDNGQLKILQVSLDTPETLPELRKLIRRHRIDFPVLYDGLEFNSTPVQDWRVSGIPGGFLISPQGVVVAKCRSAEDLQPLLDFCRSPAYSCFTVDAITGEVKDRELVLQTQASSLGHQPMLAKLSVDFISYATETGGETGKVTKVIHDRRRDYAVQELLQLDEFGEASCTFTMVIPDGCDQVSYYLLLTPLSPEPSMPRLVEAYTDGDVMLSTIEVVDGYTQRLVKWKPDNASAN